MREKKDKSSETAPEGIEKTLSDAPSPEFEEAKAKAAEYYDQLLRSRAEFENFRKRVDREKKESIAWGKQEVLMELISLVDVFEQALIHALTAKDLKKVVEGVEMLHRSFAQFLKSEGLEAIDTIGKPLDPHTSEVVEQEESEDKYVGHVLGELQKGYTYHGRVLRPSRVRVGVSRKSAASEETSKEADTESDSELSSAEE